MLSPEERQIAEYGAKQGRSKEEVLAALAKYRSSTSNQSQGYSLRETATDVYEGVNAIGREFRDAGQRIFEHETTLNDQGQVKASPIDRILGAGADFFRGGARAFGQGVVTAAKIAVPQSTEDTVAGAVEATGQAIGQTDAAQALYSKYQSLSPDVKAQVDNALGYAEGAAELVTGGAASRLTRSTINAAANAAKASGRGVSTAARATASTVARGGIGDAVRSVIPSKWRMAISDLDPQVETALKSSTPDEVNRYFQFADNAKRDITKDTPLEIVGSRAEEAYTKVQDALSNATQGKKAILNQVAGNKVPGNVPGRTLDVVKSQIGDKFGVQIDANGRLMEIKGRKSKLDAPSEKLIGDYITKLRTLGPSPTYKELDDFIDWAQSQLYKQSKEVSKLAAADDATVSYLKQVTGALNGHLREGVGNGYAQANARISDLLDLSDELNRGLGADARKGGGFVKRLFSPTGGNTREVFARIKSETGIDLAKEATLAKFAMENVGDTRQRSLLKALDVTIQETGELDLTKPASIVRFIRERADMDGQELANEFMRQYKTQQQAKKPAPSRSNNEPVSSSKPNTLSRVKSWWANMPNKDRGMVYNPLARKELQRRISDIEERINLLVREEGSKVEIKRLQKERDRLRLELRGGEGK